MHTDTSAENYKAQLNAKLSTLKTSLATAEIISPSITVFESPLAHFRMRAEFRVWHEGEISHYAMHQPKTKKIYTLEKFPIASNAICDRMGPLMAAINADDTLSHRLFQAEFLSTTTSEVLISLIYHRKLDEQWEQRAKQLEQELNAHIVGRSRKQKCVLSQDYVIEKIHVGDDTYYYQQIENSFTQPNATVSQHMLQWASEHSESLNTDNNQDLLELYCGNGNFTLPLAKKFRNVLATEVSKSSVRSAQFNIEKNAVNNVNIMRLSSEETVQALNKEREFRRLKDIDLDSYDFSTVFVDPPRAGLDETTLELVKRFDNIIYISCNPETFIQNMQQLDNYAITQFAAFDQFPYTHHLEIGTVLVKK